MNDRLKSAYKKITIHYLIIMMIGWILVNYFPESLEFLPVGTSDRLFEETHQTEIIESSLHGGRFEGQPRIAYSIFFFVCFLSAITLALPLAWVYMGTHGRKNTDPSIARAILVLPIAVSGLVLIVQNSLALAFSLAGIVAGTGMRFRTNLREFTDTMYFLIAIGVGLAAGVGSLGLSLVMSMVFCYTLLTLTAVNFGNFPPKENTAGDTKEPLSDELSTKIQ